MWRVVVLFAKIQSKVSQPRSGSRNHATSKKKLFKAIVALMWRCDVIEINGDSFIGMSNDRRDSAVSTG